jgi:hypothetical protein
MTSGFVDIISNVCRPIRFLIIALNMIPRRRQLNPYALYGLYLTDQTSYLRNIRSQRWIHLTLTGLVLELHFSLTIIKIGAPWLEAG